MIKDIAVDLMELTEDSRKILLNSRMTIEALEREKAELLKEISEIKAKLNTKISAIKNEVEDLKKEKELLQELMGSQTDTET